MPEHRETTKTMKQKVREASGKASHEARAALKTCKRRHERNIDDTKPRKRGRSDNTYSNSSILASQAMAHRMMTNHNHSSSAYPDQRGSQNAITVNVGTLRSMSQTMHLLDAYQENNDSTDGAAVNIHGQYTIAQSSAMDGRAPSGHSANIQHLTTDANGPFALSGDQYPVGLQATALRGSSFLINTMDGSYAGDHHPAEQNTTALRGSSFLTNTIDESYADDQYPADSSAMTLRGSSFVSNTMDGSFCTHELRDGGTPNLASWGPHEFA
jgi:hypothetical protein